MAVGPVFLLTLIWAFFACFLLIPMPPLKRGLHDLAAGSVVVYKGRYAAGALDALENAAKVSRALWILSGVALAVAGLFIAGVLAIKSADPLILSVPETRVIRKRNRSQELVELTLLGLPKLDFEKRHERPLARVAPESRD